MEMSGPFCGLGKQLDKLPPYRYLAVADSSAVCVGATNGQMIMETVAPRKLALASQARYLSKFLYIVGSKFTLLFLIGISRNLSNWSGFVNVSIELKPTSK